EQKKLRATVAELTSYIETSEQKSADVTAFISVVQKYERITELTPEIMHELIEKIVVHAPDKSKCKTGLYFVCQSIAFFLILWYNHKVNQKL
ncbi:MAG TPA: hypothetical protein DCG49_12880, partial [Ruminococcus sp.]|nr:hypothetical protein [Ruminococcus sp.]